MFSPFRARRPEEPRSGGKALRERRREAPASPYARPENLLLPPAMENRNPRWLPGIITGAGRLLSSVFRSDSGDLSSSSSSDTEGNEDENTDARTEEFNEVDETGRSCKACMMHGERPQLTTQRSEGKLAIEKLILQESFSRDEGDRLKKIIESRVVDTIEVGKVAGQIDLPDGTVHSDVTFLATRGSVNWRRKFPEGLTYSANHLNDLSPGSSILHAYSQDFCDRAIIEAKKWLENKKMETTSDSRLDCGPCTFNTDALQYPVEDGAGSPVDIAKSYMQARPPWQSPILSGIGIKSPPTGMVLFKDESPYARGDSFSASKLLKRSFLATDFADSRSVRLKSTEHPPDSATLQQAKSSIRILEHEACQTVDERNIAVVSTNHDSNSLSAMEASKRVNASAVIPEKLAVEDSCPEVILCSPYERAVIIDNSNSLPSSEMRKVADTAANKATKLAAADGCPEAILNSHDENSFDVNHSTNDEVDTESDKIHETCNLNSTSLIPDLGDNFKGESLNNEISTQIELPPEMETGLESLYAGCDCPDPGQTGAGKDFSVGPDSTDFISTDTIQDLAEVPQMEKNVNSVSVPDVSTSPEPSVSHNDARDSVVLLNLESEELASMVIKSPSSSKCNSDQPANDSEVHASGAHLVPMATQTRQDPAFEVKHTPVDMRPPDGRRRADKEAISSSGITANGNFSLEPGSSSSPYTRSMKKKKKSHDLPTSSSGETVGAVQVEARPLSSGAPAEAPVGRGASHVRAKSRGTTMTSIEQMLAEKSPNSRHGRGKRRVAVKSRRGRRGTWK